MPNKINHIEASDITPDAAPSHDNQILSEGDSQNIFASDTHKNTQYKVNKNDLITHSIIAFAALTAGFTALLYLISLPLLMILLIAGVAEEGTLEQAAIIIAAILAAIASGILTYKDVKGRLSGKYNKETDKKILYKWMSLGQKYQDKFNR